MSRINITQEDLLQSVLLTPGWQVLLIKSYEEKSANTDGSALYVWNIVVDEGENKGVPLRFQVSEKLTFMGIPFFEACGWTRKAGPVNGETCVGKRIEGFVERGEYNGRPQNNLTMFRALRTAAVKS